jgi:hypothetical protein
LETPGAPKCCNFCNSLNFLTFLVIRHWAANFCEKPWL